jgi:hypothetical protein
MLVPERERNLRLGNRATLTIPESPSCVSLSQRFFKFFIPARGGLKSRMQSRFEK